MNGPTTAFVVAACVIFLAIKIPEWWLIFLATPRQFNRRLAKIRARHVNWREWRRS
jgi:hypothetical protein